MPTKKASAKYVKPLLEVVENVGLIVILVATMVAGALEVGKMIRAGTVTLADLLMLFLYLEVLAMIGWYYTRGTLPVRFPLYIAMIALARFIIIDFKEMEVSELVMICGGIVLLAIAVLVIRFGHLKYPYPSLDVSKHRDTN